ncbi:helix-turn-helix domain-containing protein [Actinocatenispora sera]|uniref:TetR/AcrR family transcriptional regulator n=1 Tax=Actinocatenispora sera TaxID=390989 RepID=UPI0033DF2D71
MTARRDDPAASAPELRERVLDALRDLLQERTFESLSVAEIIAAARVSRASFYFYFAGKQAALAELVRRAVGAGHQAAQPWTRSAPPAPGSLPAPAPASPGAPASAGAGASAGGPASAGGAESAGGAASAGGAESAGGESAGGGEPAGAAVDPDAALRAGIEAGATLWLDNAGVLRAIVENWGSDQQLRQLWLDQMATFTAATTARIQADPEAMRRLDGVDVAAVAASLTWLGERLYYLAACGVPPFDDRAVLVDTLHHVWTSTLHPAAAAGTRDSETDPRYT